MADKKEKPELPPAIAETQSLDWQAALDRLYRRKSAERPVKAGDPRHYREVAADIAERGHFEQPVAEPTNERVSDRRILDYPEPELPEEFSMLSQWQPMQHHLIEHQILPQIPETGRADLVLSKAVWELFQRFGPEEAYLFLAFAASAAEMEHPWQSPMVLQGSELIKLLGWDKLTETTFEQKLQRIGELIQMVCGLSVLISHLNPEQKAFNLISAPLWILGELEFQGSLAMTIDTEGKPKYEANQPQEISVCVTPGRWVRDWIHDDRPENLAALQAYSNIARSVLKINPTRKRLAARLAVFLMLVLPFSPSGEYCIQDLLREIESEKNLLGHIKTEENRNRLMIRWNNALLSLKNAGWQITFDAQTYPEALRPNWGIEEADETSRLPIDRFDHWFQVWLKAKLTIRPGTEHIVAQTFTPIVERKGTVILTRSKPKSAPRSRVPTVIEGPVLDVALTLKGWSKAELAGHLHTDRSMITHWIKGNRPISVKHRKTIWKLLAKELKSAQLLEY